ncbi:MAG: FMN-binding protein [Acidaminococcales bacterium]|jgi:major membrane immunogen (membrane-anchored lipoprotein)|nr:FMN-binding protein [Acidaminococcales bacterium]
MNKLTEIAAQACLVAALAFAAGCGSGAGAGYKDGVYRAVSSKDQRGAYGEITITVKGGEISDSKYVTYLKEGEGKIKDQDYGKVNGAISNRDFYNKAQFAVKAMQLYNDKLKQNKTPKGIDALSGATESYRQFMEAADKALKAAQK